MAPERTVLLVGLAGGLLCLALTPPFQAPDENRHFLRAYQLSEGVLFPVAGRAELPESVAEVTNDFQDLVAHPERKLDPTAWRRSLARPLAPERRGPAGLGGGSLSTPAPYLPQALGALAGRALDLPPLAILYLCRLANLLACLAVVWTAVSIVPFYRWLFTFLALDPMALFLRSSASADALTDAAALLLVAAVLALAAGREDTPGHDRGRIALFFGAAAFLALAKGAGYLLLPGLVFLIPAERFPSRRRRATTIAAAFALALAGAALSSWAAHRAYTPLRTEVALDPAAQLGHIVSHPFHFLALTVADAVRRAPVYAIQFVGNLGWLDTPLPAPLLLGYALLLLALALVDSSRSFALGTGGRLLVAAITAGTLVALYVSQYLLWTAVGADVVEGFQGRYALPLVPAAALLLANRRWARDLAASEAAGRWLSGAAALATAVTLVRLGLRYYGP